jgi:hypothetical protein
MLRLSLCADVEVSMSLWPRLDSTAFIKFQDIRRGRFVIAASETGFVNYEHGLAAVPLRSATHSFEWQAEKRYRIA